MTEQIHMGTHVTARGGLCAPAGTMKTVVGDDALDDGRVLVDFGEHGREWCDLDDIESLPRTKHDE